jgi:hypothetical protein
MVSPSVPNGDPTKTMPFSRTSLAVLFIITQEKYYNE